jgi:hypothetical protein
MSKEENKKVLKKMSSAELEELGREIVREMEDRREEAVRVKVVPEPTSTEVFLAQSGQIPYAVTLYCRRARVDRDEAERTIRRYMKP